MAGLDSIGLGIANQGIARDYSGYDLGLRSQAQRQRQFDDASKAADEAKEEKELSEVAVDTSKWDRMYVPLVKRRSDKFFQDYNALRKINPKMARATLGQMKSQYYNDLAELKTGSDITTAKRKELMEKQKTGGLIPQEMEALSIMDSKTWDDIPAPLSDDAGVYTFDPVSKMPTIYNVGNRKTISELQKEARDNKLLVNTGLEAVGGGWQNVYTLPREAQAAALGIDVNNTFDRRYKAKLNSDPDLFRGEVVSNIDLARQLFPEVKGENYYTYLQKNKDKRDLFVNALIEKDASSAPIDREKADDPFTWIESRAKNLGTDRSTVESGAVTTTSERAAEENIKEDLNTLKATPQWKAARKETKKQLEKETGRPVSDEDAEKKLEKFYRSKLSTFYSRTEDESRMSGKDEKYDLNDFEPEPHTINANVLQTRSPGDKEDSFRQGVVKGVDGITFRKPIKIKLPNSKDVVTLEKGLTPSSSVGVKDVELGKSGIYPVLNRPGSPLDGTVLTPEQVEKRLKDKELINEVKYVPMVVGEYEEEQEPYVPKDGEKLTKEQQIKMAQNPEKKRVSVMIPLNTVENSLVKRDGNKKIVSGIHADEYYRRAEEMNKQLHSATTQPTSSQPSGRIRVRRKSDGKTGTIDEKDFNPNKYDRL